MMILDHPTHVIPAYALSLPRHLLLAPIVGLVVGVASAGFVRAIDGAAGLVERVPRRLAVFLPIAGMGTLGGGSLYFPQMLGNGYDAVNAELLGGLPLGLLFGLPFLKLAMTALCSATGVPGGLFTPSLFYGALLGGGVGLVAQHLVPEAGPPSAYALVGMAAALAGTTHAAFSATVMIFELTGSYGVILPLMLASVTSAAVSRALSAESLYTAPLARRKVKLPERPRPEWLGAAAVRSVMRLEVPRIEPTASFEEVLRRLYAHPAGEDLYVVGDGDRLLGVVTHDAVKGPFLDRPHLGVVIASDIMDTGIAPARADDSLATVAARLGESRLDNFPVVDEEGRLLGAVAAADVLRHGRF
jgi:CIC family chloride channel protein